MKIRSLSILCALFLLPVAVPAAERQFLFNNYTHADGLPDDGIIDIAQDGFGFVWVATREGVCRYDGYFFSVPPEVEKIEALKSAIYSLYIDEGNTLWALTDDSIVKLDLNTGNYWIREHQAGNAVRSIMPDDEGRLWTFSRNGTVILSDDLTREEKVELDFSPSRIFKGYNGALWLSSSDGLIYGYDKRRNSFKSISAIDNEKGRTVRLVRPVDSRMLLVADNSGSIYIVNTDREASTFLVNVLDIIEGALLQDMSAIEPNEFWFATDKGLIVYDRDTGSTRTLVSDPSVPLSLCGTNLRNLYKDNFGRIWVGSFFSGISCLESSPFRFYTGASNPGSSATVGKTIRAFTEDRDGNIWMASEDGYVVCTDADGNAVSYGASDGLPAEGNYQAIAYNGSDIYVGAYGDGVFVINPVTRKVVRRYDAGRNNIAALLVTRDDTVYAGSSDGLYRLDAGSGSFVLVEGSDGFVHALRQDRSGRIWIGYYNDYLRLLDPETMSVSEVKASPESMNAPSRYIRTTSLFEDQAGDIWMATESKGVYKIDPVPNADGTYNMVNLRKEDGLPTNVTCAIVQSPDGRLWLSTMKGIVSLTPDGKILEINRRSRIGNYFRYGAAMLSDKGRVYMGTSEGALSFHPEDMSSVSHKLFMSNITYGYRDANYSITEEGHSSVTTESISIRSRDAAYLRLTLASVSPVTEKGMEYYFCLERNGKAIETVSETPSITYASLAPGNYKFMARINGSSSEDSALTMQLNVMPPFLLRKGMLYLYMVLLLSIMAGCVFLLIRRMKRQAREAERAMEESMQKEMYESKINFFTGISHEIRTHLTLIKLSFDNLTRRNPDNKEEYSEVQGNIDNLIDFTNQVLDMRKVDAGKMTLNYAVADVTLLFRNVCRNFIPIAENYSIKFSFDAGNGRVSSLCSSSSMEKILNNLLMNGIKYCSSEVNASLAADDREIVIKVFSDGEPIPAHERAMIFKPFYQSDQSKSNISSFHGSGLGLPLSRALAEMQGGSLVLDEDKGEGNTFILTIPFRKAESADGQLQFDHGTEIDAEEFVTGKSTILIVEDDINLNNYIGKCFSEDYTIMQAGNGIEALDILGRHPVDLVISDIKMPEMDGCELCDQIKNTLEYSHIPVILLTAITDSDTQMATLRSGADAFITKPFSMDLLVATVNNLFRNREIMANKFATQPMSEISPATGSRVEDTFMAQLYEYVLENCSNPDLLSVANLADHMCVSRSTLFRKVKAKANCNVNEYVMTCRLRKSAELLSTGKYRINEVAENVGITSSSYFAKLFQKQYGLSPSAFLKSLQDSNEENHQDTPVSPDEKIRSL